jgi:hypothetical protein
MYRVQSTDTSQTGLVITSFILAAAAFIVALLILLWAVGCFDKWILCKTLRSRFYVHSSPPKSEHEIIARSTSDSTQDGTTGIVVHEIKVLSPEGSVAARSVLDHVEEAMAADEGGFEVTNTKALVRLDEMDAQSRDGSEVSSRLPILTCTTDLKSTSDNTADGNGNVEAILESYLDDEFDEGNLSPGQRVSDVAQARRRFWSKRKKKNLMRMQSPSRNMADSFSILPFGSEETEELSPTGQATVMTDFSEFSKELLSISPASRTNNDVCKSEVSKSTEFILADLLICQCEEGPVTDVD